MQVLGATTDYCRICGRTGLHEIVEKDGFVLKLCVACEQQKRYERLLADDS